MIFQPRVLTTVCAAALVVMGGALAVRAQDAAQTPAASTEAPDVVAVPARNPDDIVARVGDDTVTEREIESVGEALKSQLSNMAPAQQRSILIDTVVSMKLLAMAGRDAGLADSPVYKEQLAFLEMQALRNAYVDQAVTNSITDDELQKAYKELVLDKHQPQEEVRARHILVETKEAAEKVIADLKGGGAFEELATQSKDPSGQNGGDLGFFRKGQMVPEFETAAFALEPGKVTEEPVQSQFGWHVIKVEEKRMSEPPAFDAVEEHLRTYLQRQKFDTVLTELRQKYPVEVVEAPQALPGETPAAPAGQAPTEQAPAATPAPATEQPQN